MAHSCVAMGFTIGRHLDLLSNVNFVAPYNLCTHCLHITSMLFSYNALQNLLLNLIIPSNNMAKVAQFSLQNGHSDDYVSACNLAENPEMCIFCLSMIFFSIL